MKDESENDNIIEKIWTATYASEFSRLCAEGIKSPVGSNYERFAEKAEYVADLAVKYLNHNRFFGEDAPGI
jgi:hypothetical protein